MEPAAASLSLEPPVMRRREADRRMRRLLRLPADAPRASLVEVHNAFSRSIAVSATRCLLTYVLLPLVAPAVNLRGGAGPALGLLLGAVSMLAIVAATRRFFAADHRWRWGYVAIGGTIFVLLIVQSVIDVVHLVH
jgi:hypothetical protein